ncbi:MAG: YciI family protein [Betaproteobacteria bacterium]
MSYMLLMIEHPTQRKSRTEEEGRELYARMVAFGEQLKSRGLLIATESLKSQADAARVEIRDKKAFVSDGPFAEAKEMVGGFFLVSCQTRAEAIELAKLCPAAEWLTVEVREVAPCFV